MSADLIQEESSQACQEWTPAASITKKSPDSFKNVSPLSPITPNIFKAQSIFKPVKTLKQKKEQSNLPLSL